MPRRPDLCSDRARRTLFAIADAVHNLTDVLVPGTGATVASRLYTENPHAREWIRDQLAAFEDSRSAAPEAALR